MVHYTISSLRQHAALLSRYPSLRLAYVVRSMVRQAQSDLAHLIWCGEAVSDESIDLVDGVNWMVENFILSRFRMPDRDFEKMLAESLEKYPQDRAMFWKDLSDRQSVIDQARKEEVRKMIEDGFTGNIGSSLGIVSSPWVGESDER